MSPVILPSPIPINKEQSLEFFMAIAKTLKSLPLENLQDVYLFHDDAIVISYSGSYEPFIGFTMSYNHLDDRLYINQYSYVLERIGDALDAQGRDIPGGRVFIQKNYVYVKDLNFNHKVILFLQWHFDDPFEIVKAVYDAIVLGS